MLPHIDIYSHLLFSNVYSKNIQILESLYFRETYFSLIAKNQLRIVPFASNSF